MYHEIYGKYYELIRNLLNAGPKTEKEINDYIRNNGFDESFLYLNADTLVKTYNLFEKKDKLYYPKTKNKIPQLLTTEQKEWISLMLQDEKSILFLNDQEHKENLLKFNNQPLYNKEDYIYKFQDLDKDNINSKTISIFKAILYAIKNNKDLKLTFISSKKNITYKTVSPYKIEYSMQDQKFRLLAIEYRNSIPTRLIRIRLSSIKKFLIFPRIKEIDYNDYLNKELLKEPLIIEVYPIYNGIERVFIELSNFKRESIYDKERNCSIMKIYYEKVDELQLVLKMLSFGKVVKILSDGFIKEEVLRRLNKQKELMKKKKRIS